MEKKMLFVLRIYGIYEYSLQTKYKLSMKPGGTYNKKGEIYPSTDHEGPVRQYKYISTLSLTSALDRGGCLTPRPSRFNPVKRPSIHCIAQCFSNWIPRRSVRVLETKILDGGRDIGGPQFVCTSVIMVF
jgi:hypothetical protein